MNRLAQPVTFDERLLAVTRSRRSVVAMLAAAVGLVGNRQPVAVEAGTCVRPCGGTCCPDHHVCQEGVCTEPLAYTPTAGARNTTHPSLPNYYPILGGSDFGLSAAVE